MQKTIGFRDIKRININKEYDNLSYVLDKTNIWYGAMSTLQQQKKLNEQLIYLDKRTVTKVAPAECSEGYLSK